MNSRYAWDAHVLARSLALAIADMADNNCNRPLAIERLRAYIKTHDHYEPDSAAFLLQWANLTEES